MPELAGESLALSDLLTDPANKIVMHLAKNVFPFDVDTVALGDFEECDFIGYAPVRLVEWTIKEETDDKLGEAVSEFAEFVAGEDVIPQIITAVYVTFQVGLGEIKLLWPLWLDIPLKMSAEGNMYRKRARITSVADLT